MFLLSLHLSTSAFIQLLNVFFFSILLWLRDFKILKGFILIMYLIVNFIGQLFDGSSSVKSGRDETRTFIPSAATATTKVD